jgi:hypothetical protein
LHSAFAEVRAEPPRSGVRIGYNSPESGVRPNTFFLELGV